MSLTLYITLFSILLVFDSSHGQYTGYKVYKVIPKTEEDSELLRSYEAKNEVDFWRASHGVGQAARVMVSPNAAPSFVQELNQNNIDVVLQHNDVQKLLDEEKSRMLQNRDRTKRDINNFLDLNRYNRFGDIEAWLNQTSQSCGNLCQLESIGKSYEGRDLWLMKISSGSNKPVIYLECGIHAREWIASAVCINIINRLIFGYGPDRRATDMVDDYDWYIQPQANPDGYEFTHTHMRLWRKTRRPNTDVGSECVGTDPNRNFGHFWGRAGTSSDPCSNIYLGPRPFSEPETEAIRNYVTSIRNRVRAYFSVHSYGQYLLIPWSYGPEYPADYNDLFNIGLIGAEAILNREFMYYTVGHSTHLLGATAGSSDDWAKGDLGIKFAYTFELRDTGEYGFQLPEEQIESNFMEVFDAFSEMSIELKNGFPMP